MSIGRLFGHVVGAALVGLGTLLPQAAYSRVPYDPAFFASLSWRNIGPMLGGRATAGVGVPGSNRTYYIGTAGGGVWKTEDGGQNWHNISDGFFGTGSIGDIAIYSRNPSIIYVGTGEAPVREQMSSYGDGVYNSTDAGRTWTHVGLEKTQHISRVVIDPENPNLVYVAAQGNPWVPSSDRGVYRSSDGGTSWKRILFSSRTAGASDLVMDPSDPRTLYAAFWDMRRSPWTLRSGGPGSGIWKSTDGGETWTRLSSGLPAIMGKVRLAISPANPARLYAAIESAKTGLFRSDDSGTSWRELNSGGNVATRPWYFMGVTADPKNADVVYLSAAALLKSTDGGATFKAIRTDHVDHHTLWISPSDPQNLIATDDGGAIVSFDGGASWSSEDNQPTGQFYAVQADDRLEYAVYGGQQDRSAVSVPSRLLPGTPPYTDLGDGEAGRIALDPVNPRIVFVTNFLGVLNRRDTQNGVSENVSIWPGTHLGLSAAQMPYRFNWSAPIASSPFDPHILYHGANVLLESRDQGKTWTVISPDLTRNEKGHQGRDGLFWHDGSGSDVYDSIYVITPSPHEPGTIWVGTDDGLVQLTRDGGHTWTNVARKSWGEGMVNSIEISAHDAGTAYVAFSRLRFGDHTPHFYKTTDYGKTWTDLALNLPRSDPARVLREDPQRRSLLYAATENQLWISFDRGEDWQPLQQNMPHTPISDLVVHDDDLIAATEGRGFWILDDLTPLRQLTSEVMAQKVFLFKPPPAIRIPAEAEQEDGSSDGPLGASGANAPNGAIIRYSLEEPVLAPRFLRLDIVDADGTVVRSFKTAAARKPQPAVKGESAGKGIGHGQGLPNKHGLNQLVWDLRGPAPAGAGAAGPLVPSGRYTVRLTLGATTSSEPLEVVTDPNLGDTPEAQRAREAFARHLLQQAAEVNRFVEDAASLQKQTEKLAQTNKPALPRKLRAAVHELTAELELVQHTLAPYSPSAPPGPGDQTPMSVGTGVAYEMTDLEAAIDRASSPLTEGQRMSAAALEREWAKVHASAEPVLASDLRKVNARLKRSGMAALKAVAAP